MKNRSAVEFLGIAAKIYNTAFNCGKFATIRSQANKPRITLSVSAKNGDETCNLN